MALSVSASGVAGGDERLCNYCDTGINFVTLAFVNEAPKQSPSNYPGTNFAGHCWAGTYSNEDDVPSNLLSECYFMKEDIPYCQEKGVKVLLSIGGVYDPAVSNYEVTTEENGEYFAEFLYGTFGPYDAEWNDPRPFDFSETEHTAVDGFDFDIEWDFDNMPYIAMIETFRTLNPSLIITGAPQCPTSDAWFDMKEMVQKAAFDALFVQFYNNPSCDATESSDILSLLSGGFNFNEWEDVLDSSDMSKDAKIFIGLPASSSAAQSGYISPEELKALVCEYKDKEHFGGISLWDLTRGAANVIEGKTYNEYALEILQHGCDTPPTSTPTTSPTSKPSTSSITSSSSSSSSSTSSPSSSPHTASSSSTSATPTAADSTSRASGTSTSTSIRSSSSSRFWSNSTMTTRTSDKPTTSKTSGLLITTKTSGGSITTVTSSSAQMTTRTEYTTTTRTVTECPPHVDCPKNGYVTTEVIPTYTTVCPVTKTDDESLPETTEGLGDSEATKATSELANPTDVPGDDECEDEPPEEDDPLEPNESTGDDECEDDSSKTDEFTDGVHPTAPCDGDCEPTGGVQPPVPCEGDCPGATETKVIETVLTTITVGGSSIIKTVTQPKTYGPKPPVATPIPTGGWTSSPGNPSATETVPFEAGSSELTVGMTALAAMLAIQAILL